MFKITTQTALTSLIIKQKNENLIICGFVWTKQETFYFRIS